MAETSGLTVKLDLDVSEAITGLKAVQREAKEATKALRELESASIPEHVKKYREDFGKPSGWTSNGNGQAWFSQVTTEQLTEELARRDGIYTSEFIAGTKFEFSGPGQIIVIEK